MIAPFETLSPTSKIWIYQSNRKITDQEIAIIASQLNAFLEEWAAHGHALKSSFKILYNQMIIIAADEEYTATSGCSIDASVRAMKEVETVVGIELFDRNQVAFKGDSGLFLCRLSELKQKYVEGIWNEATLTFNNLITTKNQMDNEWIIPAGNTWLKRYMPSAKVTS